MLSKSCLICSKQSLRQNPQKDSRNTVGGRFADVTNVTYQTGVKKKNNVENQLEVIFLLRKLLEIPENTCCLLLEYFGNPNRWIECCDVCSDLVKKCHTAFEQIVSLQQYYEKLRLDIKNTILKSQKTSAIESKCEAIVRSYVITQDVSRFITSSETESEREKLGNLANNSELGNRSEISSNLDKEQQFFIGSGPSVVFNSNANEIDGENDIPVPFTDTIADTDCFVNSSTTTCENSFLSPYLYETPVLLEQINGVKSEVENFIPLNVNVEEDEIIGSMTEVSEFEENRKSQNECQNSNQKYKTEATNENPNAIKILLDKSTEDLHSYILPDCNFETHPDIYISNQVGTSAESTIKGENDLTGKKKIRRVHGRWRKIKFENDTCGIGLKSSHNLKIHRKCHTKKNSRLLKPTCRICGKSFISIQQLNNHKSSHGEWMKSLECDFCGVIFKTRTILKIHLRTHTGEKPYACKFCDRSFSTSGHLKRHHKTHTGEKPFSCDICGKSFVDKRDVEEHRRVHTGEKPFQCQVCGQLFRVKRCLQRHHRTTHNTKAS